MECESLLPHPEAAATVFYAEPDQIFSYLYNQFI
jgi:hypothetical protein